MRIDTRLGTLTVEQITTNPTADPVDTALAELIRTGRVAVSQNESGQLVFKLIRN